MGGGSRRNGYLPALDGLRTTAVLAVVAFHAGATWAPGGFLGVSLFFTLSGFLITRLLLTEWSANGRIALASFWGRRVRRLAPAALLCLGLVLVVSHWLVSPIELRALRGDVVGAAANVANWRFVTAGRSYAALFAARPSPVLHFWSLAIEEQFYLVFPCVLVLLLRLRRRWAVPAGLVVLVGASLFATLVAHDHDLIYYGTHTRAAELLIGALLAWAAHSSRLVGVAARRPRLISTIAAAGVLGFAALVATTGQTSGWLYRGGFVALAVLWCPLILAAASSGAFARVLGWSPLAAIGRRTYGIYVFHWPVFVLLTPHVLHLDGWVARAVQLAIVGGLTEVSYRVVERPIRTAHRFRTGWSMRVASLTAIAAVVAAALVVPGRPADSVQRISMLDAPDGPVVFDANSTNARPLGAAPTTASSTPAPAAAWPVSPAPAPASTSSTSDPSASAPTRRIAVIGSSMAVVQAIHRDVGTGARLIDAVRPNCALIPIVDAWPVDAACAASAPDPPASDVLVVALSAIDHQEFAQRIAASTATLTTSQQYDFADFLHRTGLGWFQHLAAAGRPVLVVDTAAQPGDFLGDVLAEVAVSTTNLTVHSLSDIDPAQLAGLLQPGAPPATDPDGAVATPAELRVMVIGDSTSYGVATGLADSPEHLRVLWAGKHNCPLVPLQASILLGSETSSQGCPTTGSGWPEALATFHPDVVVAVATLPEEGRQQYPGETDWHDPGDARYAAAHDAGLHDLLAMVAPTGAVLEVADAPANPTNGPGGWSSDADIAIWNAQVHRWDDQSEAVEALGYAGLIAAAEARAGHSLRPDGVHLDDAAVTDVVGGSLAPLLVRQVDALRAQLLANGCLVQNRAAGVHLDLRVCGTP